MRETSSIWAVLERRDWLKKVTIACATEYFIG